MKTIDGAALTGGQVRPLERKQVLEGMN